MYIADLTPLSRADPRRSMGWIDPAVPFVHVGWLGTWRPHQKGATTSEFRERLARFCASPTILHRGMFSCRQGICKLRPKSEYGYGEIVVVGDGVVFLAPSLIAHYVERHDYLPPAEFVEAVLRSAGPLCGSPCDGV